MKLENQRIGKKYGKALFELAKEKEVVADVVEELQVLRAIFSEIPKVGVFLSDSRLPLSQREVVLSLLREKSSSLVQNFLGVLFESGRMDVLVEIVDDVQQRSLKEENKATGSVTTVLPLSESQKEKLEQELAKRFDFSSVELVNPVDETILGGAIVEVNQKMIDGSVRRQLEKVQQQIRQAR